MWINACIDKFGHGLSHSSERPRGGFEWLDGHKNSYSYETECSVGCKCPQRQKSKGLTRADVGAVRNK